MPEHLNFRQKRALRLKYVHYQLVSSVCFRRNYDGVLFRCLEKQDANKNIHQHTLSRNYDGVLFRCLEKQDANKNIHQHSFKMLIKTFKMLRS
jgi:DNA-binding LacI/PurR family transcriptional regulator